MWPNKWAIEHGLALKKVKTCATESDVCIISLTSFWTKCMDLRNPHATLAVMYDFIKTFNMQDHNTLITLLSDMGTPGHWFPLYYSTVVVALRAARTLLERFRSKSYDFNAQFTQISRNPLT